VSARGSEGVKVERDGFGYIGLWVEGARARARVRRVWRQNLLMAYVAARTTGGCAWERVHRVRRRGRCLCNGVFAQVDVDAAVHTVGARAQ